VLWHYFATRAPTLAGTWQSTLKHLLLMSWSGVDLFFVISGFLITGILYDELGATNYFRTFYIRRAARILPLYLALMGTYVLFLHVPYFQQRQFSALFNPRLPLWSYATFTQNIMMGVRQIFGGNWVNVTWSLGPEEQFYAVVPCLIFLGGRKLLPFCLAIFLILAPTLRFVSPGFHTLCNTLWRADGLAAGAALAWLMRRPGWFESVSRHRIWLFGLFGLLLFGMGLMNQSKDILGPFGTTVVAAFYTASLLVTLLETQSITRRILSWRPLVWIGRRSYGIYLIHMPVYGLTFGFIAMSAIVHSNPQPSHRDRQSIVH
jgi:peptidoglycan/LPS O-acetylase OafA/YrhL